MKSSVAYLIIGFLFFCLGALRYSNYTEVLHFTCASWFLIALMLEDLWRWRVSKKLVFVSAFVAVLISALSAFEGIKDVFLGLIIGYVTMHSLSIIFTTTLRRLLIIPQQGFAIGAGDPFILAAIGGFLGYKILPTVMFLASAQGIASFVLAKLFDSKFFFRNCPSGFANAVPFGAFLCLASLELLIWRVPS